MNDVSISYPNLDLLADDGRWSDLLTLAADTGSPLAERRHVAHVIAVEGTPAHAAAVAELFPDDPGYLGPLWEVVAQRPWHHLAPHLTHPRVRDLVAQTCVLHGEDLRGAEDVRATIPLRLEPWEAASWDGEWDVPEYHRNGAGGSTTWSFPGDLPEPVTLRAAPAAPAAREVPPALARLAPCFSGTGRRPVGALAFAGTAWDAAAAVAPGRVAGEVAFTDAYPHLMHVASGKVAYGSVGGEAPGRVKLWEALRAMAASTEVTEFVQRLRCVAWQPAEKTLYHLNLAMEDPQQGVTWVLTGADDD